MTPRAGSADAAGGELSSDLKALDINLRDLQVCIETAADLETLPLTDERLQEIEAVRAAVASLAEVVTRARNRAVATAVAARWPYKRIHRVTGLSISRIGQSPQHAPDATPKPNPQPNPKQGGRANEQRTDDRRRDRDPR